MFRKIIKVNMDYIIDMCDKKFKEYLFKELLLNMITLVFFKLIFFSPLFVNKLGIGFDKIVFLYLPLLLMITTTILFIGILFLCFFKLRKFKEVEDSQIARFTLIPLLMYIPINIVCIELLIVNYII